MACTTINCTGLFCGGNLNLCADRWTPFDRIIRFKGMDLTGASLQAQVRAFRDAPGVPLVNLVTVTTTNTEGLRIVSVTTQDGVPVSLVNMHINEPTMEALPFSRPARGGDVELYWDLLINPSAALNPALPSGKARYLRGKFIVQAGATQ